jgi:hypothetical protein
MTAARLLERLDGVRPTGPGSWVAKCPAHADRRPSLAIRETADLRLLVHDFAGCSVEEILNAVGLDFDSLFPERSINHRSRRERHPFPPGDALRAIAVEALIAAILSAHVADGYMLDDADQARLVTAAGRLWPQLMPLA